VILLDVDQLMRDEPGLAATAALESLT
jgi:hypothetical protein